MADGGGIFFVQIEPGIYEVHTNFLKSYRGRYAINVSLAAYRWMFTHTDCMILLTRVPDFNKAASWFCGVVGAKKDFERRSVWPTKGGLVDMSFWSLHYEDWLRKTPNLAKTGKAFHDRLNAEFERHEAERKPHPEEECHDRYVGVCVEMIIGGQPEKGVILYNRWAQFSGYGKIALIAHNPLVIDIGEAVLQITGDDLLFKVLLCR